MKKRFLFLLIALFACNTFAQTGEKRLALVVGNSAYQNGGKLANPVNDAVLMTKTLESLGFTVIKHYNADLKTMQLATADFTRQIKNYKVALFYYAGHGVQVDGENFLIPVDAKLDDKVMTKFEALNISFVNDAFVQNKENINIMVLDACRNDPFRSWARGGERGFKVIENNSKGVIIGFATQPNSVAIDGETNTSRNGIYTEQLVKQMLKSNDIEKVFKNTRAEVNRITAGKQVPQEWSSLIGDFYFTNQKNDVPEDDVQNTEKVVITKKKLKGSVKLTSEIKGTLYIDNVANESIAQGDVLDFELTVGDHTIEIRGSEPFTENAIVTKDQTIYITARSNRFAAFTETYSSMRMLALQGGSFQMGSNDYDNEKPIHTVKVDKFYMCETEVTNEQFCKFLNEKGNQTEGGVEWINLSGSYGSEKCRIYKSGSRFAVESGYEEHPVIYVSWYAASAYAKWLSDKTTQNWRLPTEAEWEYAAKGGNNSKGYKYAGSDNINEVAEYEGNNNKTTKSVRGKNPNELGLYDMSGNVWEWCADWYKGYAGSTGVSDYTGSNRVLRGGSWGYNANYCRSAYRGSYTPGYRSIFIGFRLVRSY